MEIVRLGLVGSGGMAQRRAAAFATMEGCKLTALAARNARTGAELAQRHEVLFNLSVSGPPSLFFVYHVYPLVDLFGPAAWVEGYAHYDGLNADGAYERFVNRAVVGFAGGGTAQWTWAGGIAINRAEQYEHLVMEGGTLVYEAGGWCRSTAAGAESLPPPGDNEDSLESLFIEEVHGGDGWSVALDVALEAIRIGLGAEVAAAEGRRVALS